MSRMKDHLLECQDLLKAGEYQQLLEKLKPWGSEAPGELWAVIAWLIVMEDPEASYIDYLPAETNWRYPCRCSCNCEQGYDYQPATICGECQEDSHQGESEAR